MYVNTYTVRKAGIFRKVVAGRLVIKFLLISLLKKKERRNNLIINSDCQTHMLKMYQVHIEGDVTICITLRHCLTGIPLA